MKSFKRYLDGEQRFYYKGYTIDYDYFRLRAIDEIYTILNIGKFKSKELCSLEQVKKYIDRFGKHSKRDKIINLKIEKLKKKIKKVTKEYKDEIKTLRKRLGRN